MRKQWREVVMLAVLLVSLSGCGKGNAEQDDRLTAQGTSKETTHQGDKLGQQNYDAWLTYWDLEEGLSAMDAERERLNSVSLFEVFFNSDGDLVSPESFQKMRDKTGARYSGELYITVVNDILRGGGKIDQKDVAMLDKLLSTPESRQKLITSLLGIVATNQAQGLDLDFENIEKQGSPALQQNYLTFIEELQAAMQEQGKKLRLFIEPGEDFNKFQPFTDLEILIMCYNLFGPHGTTPGPKADQAFLQQVVNKAAVLANKTFILADGGFAWDAKGEVITLDHQQLQDLVAQGDARRDASGALTTTYTSQGEAAEAWFADQETLGQWSRWIQELDQEARFGIWRLGS